MSLLTKAIIKATASSFDYENIKMSHDFFQNMQPREAKNGQNVVIWPHCANKLMDSDPLEEIFPLATVGKGVSPGDLCVWIFCGYFLHFVSMNVTIMVHA